ncbi:MAG: bifunctional methylenetetrahydrofolate dehydrogenase/methenyltetrahydrofolate cyclohydrolase FolD [Micavibrio aeruginosavorus]|uniref:Bifunctional protein FolD n=1 Tax=Micavibrio aeruginosavorus TaxID=349221 RepID=A0A2W5N2Q8_9BACT|nr:MAG: bifunctional methylenetetrahydrofolate dehydrogenase/methenyltetrahydrofolate cyclohydrolase FolD [Micavibrio aeruginosavorus]
MTKAAIIDGKSIAADLRKEIARDASALKERGVMPALAVILVGDNPASHVYVANKIKACEEVGIKSYEHRMDANSTQQQVRHVIKNLNANPDVHGILLQLPLPEHLNADALIQQIAPEKDVDGLTYINQGKLVAGDETGLVPCTPQGSLRLIHTVTENLTGMNAVVIGRSLLFGKPMAQLLIGESCTVTTAHSKTKDLPALCRMADILVAAVGRPDMVKGNWIKPGAIVIDVGINRLENGKLTGDVDFAEASKVAGHITPVPGGVGPMTIACLLRNTLKSAGF